VEKEGEPARKRYLEFLSAGSSKEPLEILKIAGVDMREPYAVDAAIARFGALVQELSDLME
jgi:oligoendopeptidase F